MGCIHSAAKPCNILVLASLNRRTVFLKLMHVVWPFAPRHHPISSRRCLLRILFQNNFALVDRDTWGKMAFGASSTDILPVAIEDDTTVIHARNFWLEAPAIAFVRSPALQRGDESQYHTSAHRHENIFYVNYLYPKSIRKSTSDPCVQFHCSAPWPGWTTSTKWMS